MINLLSGKYQKRVAWILFFVFYGDLAASVYAGKRKLLAFNVSYAYNQAHNYNIDLSRNTNVKMINVPEGLVINQPGKTRQETPVIVSTAGNLNQEKEFIDGPGQPEMSTFRSIGADNMVNLFTGDFSYNIPLLDIDGYPVNLFYNAGITMDQEASWVGLGWNINPGTVSRNMRGLPDDYNGLDTIKKVQSIKPDLTVGVTGSTSGEFAGTPFGATLSAGIFYNNRRGLGLEVGAKGEFKSYQSLAKRNEDESTTKDTLSPIKLSAGIDLNSQNGMSLKAGFSIYKFDQDQLNRFGLSTSIDYSSRQGLTDLKIDGEFQRYKKVEVNHDVTLAMRDNWPTAFSTSINFARSSFTPSINMPLTRINHLYEVKLGKEKKALFKNVTIDGYLNEARIAPVDTVQRKPAYGYMYAEKANDDANALMDFNRLNDRVYTYKTPLLSLPVYTYDVFTINGEGTGGSFRGYRGNMGYVRDHYTKSRSGSYNVSFDIGPGNIFHGGVTFGGIYSPSIVKEWKSGNGLRDMAQFKKTDSTFQSFYFKNPGEKAIIDENYYHQIGDDELIRPYLQDIRSTTPFLASGFQVFDQDLKLEKAVQVSPDSYKKIRDKRNQVITYLTAEEASMVGLDTAIYSYTENLFQPGSCKNPLYRTTIPRYKEMDPTFYRKANHISEVDVLESDGKRYVFGIPAYEISQKEVTFSTESTASDQLVPYDITKDNSTKNKNGRDGFYQSETIPGYAHSFLLTAILSPDYVDVTGDGISEDDLGTSVKFNYTRVDKKTKFGNYWLPYKWRMPFDSAMANYNEGLKADDRDDKGLYTYGEKELWYLHSIESKNMVATFHLSSRSDGKQVRDENGGISPTLPAQRKLDRIDLYSKADFLKYGSSARPIKTVHFAYSDRLCSNFKHYGSTNVGKLTLDSIWFSYNGNERQKKNKYVFRYSEVRDTINTNPDYHSGYTDRWGSYKPYYHNPVQAKNADYPYTLQDTTYSNAYASAWNLEKVLLPSGAVLQVQYEADDYAYVQDKRACQATKIKGFGLDSLSTPSDKLYTGFTDHRFVFFDVTDPIADNAELAARYMQDFKQLLMRLWVLMPEGNVGQKPAYEPVVVYGTVKSFGLVPTGGGSFNHSRFYIELEPTKKNGSPIMETVLQFIKDNLRQRAYPGYEVIGNGALLQVVRSVWGLMTAYKEGVLGFERNLKLAKRCRTVDLDLSFARLNNPILKKIGGGHRVKRIVISDNWNRMTKKDTDSLPGSYYGQEYDYTTQEQVNNQKLVISSGVATYEPGIGNEENPFREVYKYDDKQFLGPTEHSNIEMPVTETFFPSPMVGYSKVTVRSIHNKNNKALKSGVGFQQTEFFTTRDFPVITDNTSFDPQSRHHHKPSIINKIFRFRQLDYLTLTQGFRVVLNDMNGKIKSQSSYPENDSLGAVNYTKYHYRITPYGEGKYKLDNTIPVISGPDGIISDKLIGRDVEVMNDFREHFSYTYSANIPLNADLFTLGGGFPILIPTIFRLAFRDESMFRSATTLKVVNEYGILDSIENVDKGSRVTTKNLVYDAESGDVLLSRTNNEFNKPVYQFNYPAWWTNTGMEPAYRNIDLVYKAVLFRSGRIEESPQVNMNNFESGDEIFAVDMALKGPAESPGCILGGAAPFLPQSDQFRIWAVDIRKDLRHTGPDKEFIFVDRYGNPYNAANATIRVIRSGKRNLTGASVGSIVSLFNPIRIRGGEERVIIDDTTDVLNAGAMEFKERWRANDQFFSVDTTIVTIRQVPLYSADISPANVYSAQWRRDYDDGDVAAGGQYSTLIDKTFEAQKARRSEGHKITYDQNSWIKFNLSTYPYLEGATVVNASLHLPPHNFKHQPPVFPIGWHGINDANLNAGNSHPFPMKMKFARMLTPWYDNSDDTHWKSIFFDNAAENSANNFVTFPNVDLSDAQIRDIQEVNVTPIAQALIDNYNNSSIAAGIKLSFFSGSRAINYRRNDSRSWRWCFNMFDDGGNVESYFDKIRLHLTYYKCSDSGTVVFTGKSTVSVDPPTVGYAYCTSSETSTYCFSVFTKKLMNPYVEGVLGNWHSFRSYMYYGERRESDPAAETDIRKDGIIKDFEPYWAFDPVQLARTGSAKWVWNSEITQYNRKGAELENHDPLDRYNAGIYGYQESLPVAVVNNSRLRLAAFDGFEDYLYQDDPCQPFCKPSKRHFETGISPEMLVDTTAHTGKYSYHINANSTQLIRVNVSDNDTIAEPDIRIKLDSTAYDEIVKVTPKGNGKFKGHYYPNEVPASATDSVTVNEDDVDIWIGRGGSCTQGDNNAPPVGINCEHFSVWWRAKLQVKDAGFYEFENPTGNDDVFTYVNDTLVASNSIDHVYPGSAIYLTAGPLHKIEVFYVQRSSKGHVGPVLWKKPGAGSFTFIDPLSLYSEGMESLATGSTETVTAYCVKPDTIQAIQHQLIDSFNLIAGQKMVANVWMKQGGKDCHCTGYTNSFRIRDASDSIIATFQPKEGIIEGWQQFEAVFIVPESNDHIQLDFQAPVSDDIFIDDLRLHPFNANMKSFVYDPFNLRLVAELDENNFATFYEYDDEGTLTRVKKETRLGIKTITETRSSLQKKISDF